MLKDSLFDSNRIDLEKTKLQNEHENENKNENMIQNENGLYSQVDLENVIILEEASQMRLIRKNRSALLLLQLEKQIDLQRTYLQQMCHLLKAVTTIKELLDVKEIISTDLLPQNLTTKKRLLCDDANAPYCSNKKAREEQAAYPCPVEDSKKRAREEQSAYLCPIAGCDRILSSKYSLQRHKATVHCGERQCVCTFCGKSFGQPSTLKRHIQCHTGEKPFECHVCDKKFGDKVNLKRHLDLIHHRTCLY